MKSLTWGHKCARGQDWVKAGLALPVIDISEWINNDDCFEAGCIKLLITFLITVL